MANKINIMSFTTVRSVAPRILQGSHHFILRLPFALLQVQLPQSSLHKVLRVLDFFELLSTPIKELFAIELCDFLGELTVKLVDVVLDVVFTFEFLD